MPRILDDWISTYMEYTKDTESPESYQYWTAVSLIAATLQRKVYVKWGFDTIYPNFYIILVGPSGRTRKTVAIEIGKPFLDTLNIATTAESLTREQLIKVFTESIDNFLDRTTNEVHYHSSLLVFSREFSVFLGQKDIRFLADLTDWYDSPDRWRYETKTSGTFHIKGVCLNILGATAPDWFQSILPDPALSGGFTARCIFVNETKKRQIVVEPKLTRAQLILREQLIHDLGEISKITGEYTLAGEAIDAYAKFYTEQEERIEKGEYPVSDPRFHTYCERRATHIKKLCMVLCASHSDIGLITLPDFKRAKALLERTEAKMSGVFGGVGMSPLGVVINNIREFLMVKRQATREELMRNFYNDVGSSATLDQILTTLVQMNHVMSETREIEGRKQTVYLYKGG